MKTRFDRLAANAFLVLALLSPVKLSADPIPSLLPSTITPIDTSVEVPVKTVNNTSISYGVTAYALDEDRVTYKVRNSYSVDIEFDKKYVDRHSPLTNTYHDVYCKSLAPNSIRDGDEVQITVHAQPEIPNNYTQVQKTITVKAKVADGHIDLGDHDIVVPRPN